MGIPEFVNFLWEVRPLKCWVDRKRLYCYFGRSLNHVCFERLAYRHVEVLKIRFALHLVIKFVLSDQTLGSIGRLRRGR